MFKNWKVQWFIPIIIIGIELLFHYEVFGCFDMNMLWAVFFAVPYILFVYLVSTTGNRIWNVISSSLLLLWLVVYGIAQIVYHQVFGNFMSLKSILNGAGQAMDFGSTIWEAALAHLGAIVVMLLLWIVYVVLAVWQVRRKQETMLKRASWKTALVYLMLIALLPVLGTVGLMSQGTGMSTAYDVKMQFHRTEQSMYRLGLLQTMKKDLMENVCDLMGVTQSQLNVGYTWLENALFPKADLVQEQESTTEELIAEEDTEEPQTEATTEEAYHEWDIDFDAMMASGEGEDISEVHKYFFSVPATKENAYTGLFEGYNLIYITAESFSDVVIDKERTPTLYRMQQEGFQFENFYTPSWYLSTIDGEYVNCLSQIPVDGDWSLQHSAENELPFALGNQLQNQGYLCNAYHNHDAYYYDRTITHPKLGYTFKADGSGLDFQSKYPESDLELMEITVDEYIGKGPFHTYYMTMSGHLPYTYGYNSMAVKHRDVVEGKEWSENAACYLAAHMELENSVAYLIERLEASGQLNNTLFVIVADHYPYGLKSGAYDELRGYEVEDDDFEKYRNGCLIWSASMKDMTEVTFPVKVDTYCSNLDLLPTISNLMGLSFDSRLLAGRDMLSADAGLVMFKDHSFLTEKVRYNATTGEATWAEGEMENQMYLEQCMKEVENRFYYSAKILELDYFSKIVKRGSVDANSGSGR